MAYSTQENLHRQRSSLGSSSFRVTGLASRFPGLNNLIGKIQARKRRDQIIMAGVVAFCIILLMLYMLA